jgi:hypothetical protein
MNFHPWLVQEDFRDVIEDCIASNNPFAINERFTYAHEMSPSPHDIDVIKTKWPQIIEKRSWRVLEACHMLAKFTALKLLIAVLKVPFGELFEQKAFICIETLLSYHKAVSKSLTATQLRNSIVSMLLALTKNKLEDISKEELVLAYKVLNFGKDSLVIPENDFALYTAIIKGCKNYGVSVPSTWRDTYAHKIGEMVREKFSSINALESQHRLSRLLLQISSYGYPEIANNLLEELLYGDRKAEIDKTSQDNTLTEIKQLVNLLKTITKENSLQRG